MVRKKLTNIYQTAQSRSREHIDRRPYILPILGLLFGVLIVLGVVFTRHGQTLKVTDYHIVLLSQKGQTQPINTKAKTVGELLKNLSIKLNKQDVVEPARNTKIPEDNYRVNIYRARPVTVIDGKEKKVTLTAQRSARVVAQHAGLKVAAEDDVVFDQGNLQSNTIGEEVVVKRAVGLTLIVYGEKVKVKTTSKTVGDFLIEKNITLAAGDTVKPAPLTRIKAGMTVQVIHNGTKVITKKKIIPAPVHYVTDSSLSFGAEVVRQPGQPGKQLLTIRVVTKKGKVVQRKILQRVTIQNAVPSIVARGNVVNIAGNKEKIMAAAGISGSDYAYVNFIISRESGWNPAARNAGGCLGLGQACPGSKLPCSTSDPVCQLRYFSGYAKGRYGGWGGAYNFWLGHNYW